MKVRIIAILLAALLLSLTGGVLAQASNPTVAIVSFGTLPATTVVKDGVIDVLRAHAYLTDEERAALADRQDLAGENINILWRDANFELTDASLIIDSVLDIGVDALLTISTPMTQLAVNATSELEAPPAVIFTSVYNPFVAGIAQSACIKPAHVTGVSTDTPYDQIMGLLRMQAPQMRVIGTIFNPAEIGSHYGAQAIAATGTAMGFQVEQAAAPSLSDVGLAAEALVNKGVQAIVTPLDNLVHRALPLLSAIADENDIMLYAPTSEGVYFGASIGAGPSVFYRRGVNAGHILAAHLGGSVDIGSVAISSGLGMGIGINLDAAAAQNVTVAEQILDWAGFVIADGELRMSLEDMQRMTNPEELQAMVGAVRAEGSLTVAPELGEFVDALAAPDFAALTADYVAELACTPERIAEEEAELADDD